MRRSQLRSSLQTLGLLNAARDVRDRFLNLQHFRSNCRFWWRGAGDGLPVPPLRLVRLATGTSSLAWSFQSGALAAESIAGALARHGVDIRSLARMLDFGCGYGRVARYWATLPVEVHGCDYNRAAVRWCRRNLRFARFEVNALEPPLPYADGYFDLAYALSVFTHLPGPLLLAWRRELLRVLKPGGLALVTTHGEAYVGELTADEQAQFRSGLPVFRHADDPGTNRCGVYFSERYVRDTFADGLTVLDYVPTGAAGNPYQDLVLLQKPA